MGKRERANTKGHGLLADEVAEACHAMARHALATGRALPEWTVELLAAVDSGRDAGAARLPELVRAHRELAELVAPARPEALVLLERERRRGGILRSFGPVRLVRQLIVASALFLVAFVASSLSPHVDAARGDLFDASGTALLANQLFLLSAAGVGACFAALFRVNHHLTEGTYDPRYDASYWIRLLLGLIAGVVLAALMPVEGQFTRPLLALGGGFAAPVLYRVLTRTVDKVESVGGGGKKEAASPDDLTGPALAAVATDEGTATVLAAAAPAGAAAPPPSAPPAEIPPELEGPYRARIVFDGGHVGAARALDGPALARAAIGKLKTIARAAAVAKIGAELSGPFGDVFSEVAGDDPEDMTVEIADGVATGPLHEWATGRGEAPEREIAVDLYDDEGDRSSTLKLKDSRVREYQFEEDPGRPGSYLIHRLVLVQSEAEWLVGALNPIDEAQKLFAKPDAPPPPPPPCRGSFARGVAAGLLLALVSAGALAVRDDGEPAVLPVGPPSCDDPALTPGATCEPAVLETLLTTESPSASGSPSADPETPTPGPVTPTPEPETPTPTPGPETPDPVSCPPVGICTPSLPPVCVGCPSPPPPVCVGCPSPPPPVCVGCPSPPPPVCVGCPSPPPPVCVGCPSPPPPVCVGCPSPPPPPVFTDPPTLPSPRIFTGAPEIRSAAPSPPPPPRTPSPSPPGPPGPRNRRCKQPPDAPVLSEAHSRHPGCALYHSEAEPPGHALPPPPGAPAPVRPVAPAATAPPELPPAPRPVPPPSPPAPPEPTPESENAPALPPGLEKRKDGLPPGLEKKRRRGPRPATA